MGYAKLVGGGEDGRYTIEIDFGSGTRTATIAKISAFISKMELDIASTNTKIAAAEANIVPLRLAHAAAVQDYIDAAEMLRTTGHLPPGTTTLTTKTIDFYAAQIKRALAQMDPLRRRLDALKFLMKTALADLVKFTNVVAVSTRDAWCTTLTEDGTIGSYVATVDIPGDSNLVLVAPECRAPQLTDGYLRARALMSPEQAFWTTAVQPGWQNYKPTYRWGTCTGINFEANTMTVALFDQKSDAQQLPVNQAETLTDVPVVYLSCGAQAFSIDDRVVVQFQGQNWAAPRVIGFLDNPKPCGWPCVDLQFRRYHFASRQQDAFDAILNAANGTLLVQVKINSGSWQTLPQLFWNPGVSRSWLGTFVNGYFIDGLVGIDMQAGYLRVPGFSDNLMLYVHSNVDGLSPERNTAEFRILRGPTVIINVAIQSTAPPIGVTAADYPGAAKTLGGIFTPAVLPLDYPLTGQEP